MAASQESPWTGKDVLVVLLKWAVLIGAAWLAITFVRSTSSGVGPVAQAALPSVTMTPIEEAPAWTEPIIRSEPTTVTITQSVTTTVTTPPTSAAPSTTAPALPLPPPAPKAAPSPTTNKTGAIATARRAWCTEHGKRVTIYNAFGALSTNRQATSPWAQETKKVLSILYTNYTTAGGKPEPAMAKYAGPLGHIIGQQWLSCGPV